jgi:hypothetical protein
MEDNILASATSMASVATTGSSNRDDHVPTEYVPQSAILDGTYFTVTHVDSDGIKLKAMCNTCVTKTVISGSVNAVSNFVTHLKVRFN